MSQLPIPGQQKGGTYTQALEAVLAKIPAVYFRHTMRSIGYDNAAADDICQQTALDLYLYWHREGGFDEQRIAKTFWTILNRRISDHLDNTRKEVGRRHLRGLDGAHHDGVRPLAECLADPGAEHAFAEVVDALDRPGVFAQLLDGIPDPQRQALLLVHVDKLDQAAAAASLGLSVRGLQARLHAGRTRLRANYRRHRDKTPEEDNR
ncbi:hypothetical protein UO65_0064 [Actinokineospora spheciospongiae]|uniref:RNA polymerase sigma factor 70 region 4 type 2 domain-containing protein n=1 Tax=Actinokineospora spheciospongiae TaxID=909613 RepID=W7J621_9PSEU|nr:sigma factor-like helix-turn-helix DNA-binding protein [Actinokineospora spheciospongiae]EWC64457.1 hypothetical protein UO65_0064 [Actinokineospora spheciospongiae]